MNRRQAASHAKLNQLGPLDLRGKTPEIPEDGAFFQDNALQKASFALDWWTSCGTEPVEGVLADDSGLCVDALWGGPGVLSARFAPALSWADKNALLLSMVPPDEPRTARFVCVLAWIAIPRGAPVIVSGSAEGALCTEGRGKLGFGFDPVFIPAGSDRTFAEMPPGEKHALSHRARACASLRQLLTK